MPALEDQGKNIRWNNGNNLTTDATPKDIGWGKFNTDKIVVQQGSGAYAASICDQLVYGGYSDWYLPSIYELNQLQMKEAMVGGFQSGKAYWSSSESNTDKAWVQVFGQGGGQSNPNKSSSFNVRAIRSF